MVAQGLAVAIFVAMFVLIVMDKFGRQYITLGCGALTLIGVFGICMRSVNAIWEIINLRSIFTLDFWYQGSGAAESGIGINWETVIFIACMMIMVEGMARVGFFDWLCMRIAKINPVPMIMAEIFCANLGGSATMCGDPPNIIIGTALHYSFADFVSNTGVIAGISLIVIVVYFYFVFRKDLKVKTGKIEVTEADLDPSKAIHDKKGFVISTAIFLLAVALLVTHAQTKLTVAFIGVLIAVLTLLAAGKHALTILKKVDYETILFFIGLFVVVGGLEETGVLELIADAIKTISGGNSFLMIGIIIWLSAVASALVDNIPFAATMVPVIKSLGAGGPAGFLPVLAWGLSMGTDIGGSATPIGASANVVGISVAEKEGHRIGWGKYCKAAVPATLIVVLISMIVIFIRYGDLLMM